MKKIIILLSVLLGFISCSTVKEIPSDLSAAQLLQLGQNAFESKNYKAAEKYFITTIQRFGTNTNNYIEAQYELAHLYNIFLYLLILSNPMLDYPLFLS